PAATPAKINRPASVTEHTAKDRKFGERVWTAIDVSSVSSAPQGSPVRPVPAAVDQTRREDANPRPQPWQACGYCPGDCRGAHALLQETGGGALTITLCGSKMPSTVL